MMGAKHQNARGRSAKPCWFWVSLSLPLILEYRLNIISVNAPLRSEENSLSSPQMCWKSHSELLREGMQMLPSTAEDWTERSTKRQELAERETPRWCFKIQCHTFVAFLWKPGGILRETSSLKTSTDYYMLAGSQRSWTQCSVALVFCFDLERGSYTLGLELSP